MPKLVADFWQRELKEGGVRLPMVGLSFTKADLMEWKGLYEKDLELVRLMHNAGVQMLAGTDTPAPYVVPGHSLHEELGLFVEAGMTPAEALRTATLNPARCLGREKDLGTIEAGKYADLVLLSANPLIDIRNTHAIEMVTVGGRVVPR
jgi:imidazolonepropionase-like amidohydrolase